MSEPTPSKWIASWQQVFNGLVFLALACLSYRGCAIGPPPAPVPIPEPPQAISIPAKLQLRVGQLGRVPAETRGKLVRWRGAGGLQVEKVGDAAVIVAAESAGTYELLAWTCADGEPTEAAVCLVNVGGVDPKPPEPGPGPKPPPPPIPTPPIPQGFRAVLVYESGSNMTKAQLAVLYSPAVEKYLTAKTEGGKGGWRRWDKDVDTKYEAELWRNLWTAAKPGLGALPAVVLVGGQKGETHPLPATEAEMMALLKKWGG